LGNIQIEIFKIDSTWLLNGKQNQGVTENIHDLEYDGPNHRTGKTQDQIMLALVEYVLIH